MVVPNIQTATFALFLKNFKAKKQPSGIDKIVGVRIAKPGKPNLLFILMNLRFCGVKIFFGFFRLNLLLKYLLISGQILELNKINAVQPVNPPREQTIKVV